MLYLTYECHMILYQDVLKLIRRALVVLSLMFAMLLSVAGSVYGQSPIASFSVPSAQGCVPFNVQFTNTSSNAISYQWNFGNGNTSVVANPGNVFTLPGVYNVSLTASSANGLSSTTSAQITVNPKPVANFSVSLNSGCQGAQVFDFQNQSTLFDSCVWDFGDGTTSNLLNPQHIYNIPGTFSVTLVVYSIQYGCSNLIVRNNLITIYPSPSAILTVNDTSSCDKQFLFQFGSQILNASSWVWDFGDNITSNFQNPSHVFADTGYFQVQLNMTSSFGCSSSSVLSSKIHLKWNPIPNVVISDDTGCKPHLVSLITNYYANSLYSWDLGNGVTNTGSTVYYSYPDSGLFPITLNVNYSSGCQQTVSAGPIYVLPKPNFAFWMTNITGCAPLVVQCVNQSAGTYSWLWDFGDGTTSTQMAPSHVYINQGIYSVNLTGTSSNGCTYSYTQGLKVSVLSPEAALSTDVTSGCPPLMVNFTNNSIRAVSYLWDFGDGTTSNQIHPSHVYNTSGNYNVKLIASDASGCTDTLIIVNKIIVASAVVSYQTPPIVNACAPYAVNFSDASGASSFLWDFGDGTTSSAANPYHVYTNPGVYTVSLTTWMPNGGCEQYIQNFQTFNIDGAYPGFTYTVSPCPPYEVFFTDTSLNASSWQWSFGDGGNSSLQNPSHIYPGPGMYSIRLICTTPSGCNTTLNATNAVVITGLGAHGTSFTTDTVAPINVQFAANSTGATWWLWTFGDGGTSTLENPTHVYQSLGPFTITLTIGNDSCQYTYNYPPITFGPNTGSGGGLGGGVPPTPPRVYHCAPFTVSFTNPDPSAIGWLWNFGDGNTSNSPSPTHAYTDSGAFVTSLYLYYSGGVVDSLVFTDTSYVVKPISDFVINKTNLCTNVVVDVQTTAPGNYFKWDFGAGLFYNTPTASYSYPNINASYMISLNVTDTNNCSSFIAKSFAVNVTSIVTSSVRRACANDSILFNAGNVNYAQYIWDFGDGNFSNQKNPVHAFADSGLFNVNLQVVDINGCIQNFSLTYLIEVFNPIANFTYATLFSNCTSGAVLGTVNNLSTGSSSWLWQFGDGSSSSLFSPPTHAFYMPNFNGFYDITLIVSKNICNDTLVIPNAIFAPKLNADFTYVNSSDCVPSIATFTDGSVDAVSWFWNFGDGDTSTLQNPIHQYLISPRDSITLTVHDIYGCVKTKTLPAPNLTQASFMLSEDGGCAPFQVQFSDSSTNAVSWNWLLGDGNSSVQLNPSHVYVNDGYFNVSLVVTSQSGCTDTLSIDSLVEVNTPIANFSVSNDSGCAPLLISFYDLSTNVKYWNWDLGNGNTSGNAQPSIIYATPGVYDVTLTVENKFGCLDSLSIDSAVVVQGPIPSFTVSSELGCTPFPVSFNNLTTGAVHCEWHFGDGTLDTIFSPTHVYSSAGNYSVNMYAFDNYGCSAVYSYPVPIVIGTSPESSFLVDVTSGCAPLTVTMYDALTIADSIVYDMGDGTVISGSSPVYSYSAPGDYIVTMIAYNDEGCSDTLVFSDTIHVLTQPHAEFMVDVLEGCSPVSVNFTNNSTGLSNSSFNWDFDDGNSLSSFNATHTYINPDVYTITLTVTNDNGCTDDTIMVDLIEVYDEIPPPITNLYRVSVNNSSEVELNWQQTNVNDLDYYEVYKWNDLSNVYDTLAKVYHANNGTITTVPTYKDSLVNTDSISYSYKVQAVDNCGLRQELSLLKAHETILLNSVAGHQQVSLSWSPYGGCSISGYEIFRQDQGGALNSIGLVDTLTFNFLDSSTFCPYEYIYKVKAIAVCGNAIYDSWSNPSSATPTSLVSEQFVDVVRSTVVDNQYVLTEWMPPVTLPNSVLRYDIFRSTDQINFSLIASVPSLILDYSDFNVSVSAHDYYYKILVRNVCDVDSREGLVGSSILLTKLVSSSGNYLRWTQYKEWNTGVDYYVIEKLNEAGVWKEIDRVPGAVTNWEEK